MPEDSILLERVNAGDREAFDSLVKKYQREIYFLALRFVKNREDAEEVTQQAFVKAFEKLSGFRGDASFKTWLYQVAMNQSRSFLRSRKTVLELNEEVAQKTTREDTPLGGLMKSETALEAAQLIQELPEKQKNVVTLRIVHELSYREIGEIVDCSEQTAKVNFHYGIENLRKKMKQNGLV